MGYSRYLVWVCTALWVADLDLMDLFGRVRSGGTVGRVLGGEIGLKLGVLDCRGECIGYD